MNKFVHHVKQLDPKGSAVAVLAMLTGQRYDEVLKSGFDPRTDAILDIDSYLAERGYAIRRRWILSVTPPEPWSDVHFAKVRTGPLLSDHYVVVLRSGDVLDPDSSVLRKLSDYPWILHVASVHKVYP